MHAVLAASDRGLHHCHLACPQCPGSLSVLSCTTKPGRFLAVLLHCDAGIDSLQLCVASVIVLQQTASLPPRVPTCPTIQHLPATQHPYRALSCLLSMRQLAATDVSDLQVHA